MAKLSKERILALKNEVRMSEKMLEEEVEPIISENIRRYTGSHVPAVGQDWEVLINEIYPIVQINLPSTFFRNPRAFLKPRNEFIITKKYNPVTDTKEEVQVDAQKSAKTQEGILNYALSKIDYKKEARRVLMDSLLYPYGVMWHGFKGDFGMTEENSILIKKGQVFAKRISPLRFIYDPSVNISNIDEGKWVGRLIDVPLQDIIEDKELDVDKTVRGFEGFGQKVGLKSFLEMSNGMETIKPVRKSLLDFADKDFKKSLSARFVRVAEIFIRPTKKEAREGSKGHIVLLTEEQQKPLRVNDWVVKGEGFPIEILELNELPDAQFGLDDISTYKGIADQKNIIFNQQIHNARTTGKVWVGISKEGADEEDIDMLREGSNTIFLFNGDVKPSERMFVASAGGQASSELYTLDQRIQSNLDNASGVSDLKRGVLRSGEESATSVRARLAGSSARPAFRQDLMADFLTKSFGKLNDLLKQFMPFKDAVRVLGTLDVEWTDKPSKEDLQADVDVEIDPVSMLPEDPQKESAELRNVLALMIDALSNPQIYSKIQQEGNTFNLSPIIEQLLFRLKIRNPDVFRRIEDKESEGFVSVRQMREAQANVQAGIQGATIDQVPFPPREEDDHRAKGETYMAMAQLAEQVGQNTELLQQLILSHQAFEAELAKKAGKTGNKITFNKPQVTNV